MLCSREIEKLCIERALAAGRMLQSKETGFLHYNPQMKTSVAIPVYENALFILALFRSRMIAQVQEGKELLKKLLFFQNEEGAFPRYLHEYPFCLEWAAGVRLLAPFYWMMQKFGFILGQELRDRLREAVIRLLSFLKGKKKFPYPLAVRYFAALFSFGTLWHKQELLDEGERGLLELENSGFQKGCSGTLDFADLLIGLQMAEEKLHRTGWNSFIQFVASTWHLPSRSYGGPCFKEIQEETSLKPNFYTLFFGDIAETPSAHHLQGSLYPFHTSFFWNQPLPDSIEREVSGEIEECSWKSFFNSQWACTYVISPPRLDREVEMRRLASLRLIWKYKERMCSFVSQGNTAALDQVIPVENGWDLFFDLREEVGQESGAREVQFYTDALPGSKILVEGAPATTFKLGDAMRLECGAFSLNWRLDLIEGSGEFIGHVTRGNRPSREKTDFSSYDWHCFLRTLRRNEKCRIKFRLEIQTGNQTGNPVDSKKEVC